MTKENGQYLIIRDKNIYEVVIGLEVHAQVLSKSKLFSSSPTKFGAEPNTQVSLVDAAFPGMLPVINEFCIKQAIKTGIGLKAKINKKSVFDRKNYFYADLPQGYQISQYKNPIVGEGTVILDMPYGQRKIGIERLHLEQDAGKSIHDMDPKNTLVDLNRSGIALMEIVSKPDLKSLEEALTALMDTSEGLRRYASQIEHDPSQLEKVESRLQDIESLKRRYGGTMESVLSYHDEIKNEIASFKSLGNEIDDLKEQINTYRSDYQNISLNLHEMRSKSVQELCTKIENELANLNIPGAKFEVRMELTPLDSSDIELSGQSVKYGPKGFDQIEFYLSANPGEATKPLTDVASGGEVSRIMLAIKTIFQEVDPVDTLVFDEIDSGISGVAAEKVGEALLKLSKSKQIICVSHLPQIAAKANNHIHISKMQKDGRTIVKILYLNNDEKIHVIAQLFSGESMTPLSIASAEAMMGGVRG